MDTASVHNLPVVEGQSLVIHLTSGPPVIVACTSTDKLNSLQLAMEYCLLLGLPYKPVANVHFNSLVNQD